MHGLWCSQLSASGFCQGVLNSSELQSLESTIGRRPARRASSCSLSTTNSSSTVDLRSSTSFRKSLVGSIERAHHGSSER